MNYKLLNKCSEEVWEKNLKNEKSSEEDIIDNNDYLSHNEEEFINNNLEELNNWNIYIKIIIKSILIEWF